VTARGAEESLLLSAVESDAPEAQDDESEVSPLAIQPRDEEFAEPETGRTLAVKEADEESLGGTITVVGFGMGESLVTELVTCPLTVSGRAGLVRVAVVAFSWAVVEQLVSEGAELTSCTAEVEQVDSEMMSL
jgi:hypothetical protein